MSLREISAVINEYKGLARKTLEYSLTMKELVDAAKQPGFAKESWAALTNLVAIDVFERMGSFMEVMNWRVQQHRQLNISL